MPKGLFEFVDRGTENEVALRNNRAVFDRIKFKPRTLVDVSTRSQENSLLGQKQPMPIVVAPTGIAGMMWYEGEIALARAARAAGIPFTLATGSLTRWNASRRRRRSTVVSALRLGRSLAHVQGRRARKSGGLRGAYRDTR